VTEVAASVLNHSVDMRLQPVVLSDEFVVWIKRSCRVHEHSRTCQQYAAWRKKTAVGRWSLLIRKAPLISQGSVTTRSKRGAIVNDDFIIGLNLAPSLTSVL